MCVTLFSSPPHNGLQTICSLVSGDHRGPACLFVLPPRITDQLLLFILVFIITFIHSLEIVLHSQRTISKQYPIRFFSVDLSSILSTVVKFKPRFSFMNCAGLVHEPHCFVVFLSPALHVFGQGVPVVHVF